MTSSGRTEEQQSQMLTHVNNVTMSESKIIHEAFNHNYIALHYVLPLTIKLQSFNHKTKHLYLILERHII